MPTLDSRISILHLPRPGAHRSPAGRGRLDCTVTQVADGLAHAASVGVSRKLTVVRGRFRVTVVGHWLVGLLTGRAATVVLLLRRFNSVGRITVDGHHYLGTVLSDGSASMSDGISPVKRAARQPTRLSIADLDAPTVGAFLQHLETVRGNTAATRHIRLAAMQSFLRYEASIICCEYCRTMS